MQFTSLHFSEIKKIATYHWIFHLGWQKTDSLKFVDVLTLQKKN